MKNVFTNLKGKGKYLKGTFFILFIFLVDCLTGSVSIIMGQAETEEEWFNQIIYFSAARSVFAWMPYLVLLYLANFKVSLSKEDEALLVIFLIFSFIETGDYFTNYNWRPVWLDYVVLTIFVVSLLYIKIKRLSKQ